jgi:hypothetical protein
MGLHHLESASLRARMAREVRADLRKSLRVSTLAGSSRELPKPVSLLAVARTYR